MFSNYTRIRIELLHKQDLHPAGIFRSLKNEGLLVSLASISQIIKKLQISQITGSVVNLPCLGRPTKLSVDAKAFIDQQMQKMMRLQPNRFRRSLQNVGLP